MTKIFIIDGQTDDFLDWINKQDVIDNIHERDMSAMLETFKFTAFADRRYSQHLTDKNRLVIPGEDGEYREFVIKLTDRYRDSDGANLIDVTALASFQELIGAKVVSPTKTAQQSAEVHVREILAGTEIEAGNVAYKGLRAISFDNYTDPFSALKKLATEFELELDFRVEINSNRITKRYVDLVERVGGWRGRHVEFGKDLQGIRRKEDSSEIVTALLCLGPEMEDGTRLEVYVEDKEALERWGRRGQHIVSIYEPQSEGRDMTEENLIRLGKAELKKRINAIVSYEANIIDLEHITRMENKRIRFGDIVKIKDTTFNPPLFVEARIYKQNRNIFNPASKKVELGDFIEYTVEQVQNNWKAIRDEIDRKVRIAELRAGIGDIRFTIIGYREPLRVQKSSVDSQFDSLVNNLDLDTGIRNSLTTVKASYDNTYGVLLDTIDSTVDKEELTEDDLQQVNVQYANYESGLAELTRLFEFATDTIAKRKADDAEDGANRYTDEHLVDINLILERAQERIDEARNEIEEADKRIGDALDELENLENRLNELDGDKVNIIDYDVKIKELTDDIADKVDGQWVGGQIQIALDNLEIGGYNLARGLGGDIYNKNRLYSQDRPKAEIVTFNGKKWIRYTGNNLRIQNIVIEPNTTYTWSFTAYTTNNPIQVRIYDWDGSGYGGVYHEIKTTPTRIKHTFTTNSNSSYEILHINNLDANDVYYFADFQLQKGNKATDWSYAPEDIFADIELKANVDDVYVKSQIDSMFDNVVSYTVYQADQEGIVERFDSIETKIYQNEQAVGVKVDQTTYDTTIGQINNRMAQWEMTADGIEQSVSNLQYDIDHMEIGGRNIVSLQSVSTSGSVDIKGYVYTINRTSSGNPYIRVTRERFEEGNYYVATFKVRKISGNVVSMGGHTNSFSVFEVYRDGVQVGTSWSSADRTYPDDTEMHEYRVYFKALDSFPSDSAPYWYIQPNRPSYGQDYVVEIWDFQIEEGNRPTGWAPAPEDQIHYTETRIRQLANEIDLSYVKNNEVISRINLSSEGVRIDGSLLEITGDTLIHGNLSARDATFLDMTTRNMTAINATIQSSTVTGNLTATNATFLQGTFNKATIVDATIQNATITGRLNGATGTFRGDMTAGSINIATDATVGNNLNLGTNTISGAKSIRFFGATSYIRSEYVLQSGFLRNQLSIVAGGTSGIVTISGSELILTGTNLITFEGQSSAASIDITGGPARWRQSNSHYIMQNTVGEVAFYKDGSQLARFSHRDGTTRNPFFRMGGGGLKFLSSGSQIQVRNSADTGYIPITASAFNPPNSSFKTKKNIDIYTDSTLEKLRSMELYTFHYNYEIDTDHKHLGIMVEESPEIIMASSKETIDLYSTIGFALKGIKELDRNMEDHISWLKTENQYLKNEMKILQNKIEQLEEKIA
ncbi:phage tail protein [Ornithinibacillus massiliensis]|uniref:Phage tail protein n=1 Tax=Ornithinibacillus massiliensis TaxID=1944633 RepID=A0ABS5MI47_9BACI|nr:phage tail spike protein [Ornithinibacillus massiliensis]MBS3681787.1 phage tail protein [Ornithinibacillus massiliensis]